MALASLCVDNRGFAFGLLEFRPIHQRLALVAHVPIIKSAHRGASRLKGTVFFAAETPIPAAEDLDDLRCVDAFLVPPLFGLDGAIEDIHPGSFDAFDKAQSDAQSLLLRLLIRHFGDNAFNVSREIA
jgi:hypothetical protein